MFQKFQNILKGFNFTTQDIKDLEKQVPIDWGGWDTYLSTIQWKAVISQAAIIWLVSGILGFLVSWVLKSLLTLAIINLTCLITAFTLIHYFTKENRFQHCIHVAVACWLTSIINVVFFGIPFISWLLSAFFILVCVGIGMLISYLIGLSKNN